MSNRIILPHGGYQRLLTYRKSEIIFLGTARFVERFLTHGDRTIDQMVQARSGKQNIVEGSEASATSTAKDELDARVGEVLRQTLALKKSISQRKERLELPAVPAIPIVRSKPRRNVSRRHTILY